MGVVIGVDPRKRSNTALVIDANERVLDRRRFTNDKAGYRELKTWARTWKDRTWAVEGARGVGLSLPPQARRGKEAYGGPALPQRRLSDAVFRALLTDLARREHTTAAAEDAVDQPDLQQLPEAGPGGHLGATLQSSATGPTPTAGSSDKSLPGPANQDATPNRQHLPEAS